MPGVYPGSDKAVINLARGRWCHWTACDPEYNMVANGDIYREVSRGKDTDMTDFSGKTRRAARARVKPRRPAAPAVILALALLISVAAAACSFEWGGRTGTTVSTTPADTGQTGTTTLAGSSTTVAGTSSSSADVIESGTGSASPAQVAAAVMGPSVVNIASTGTEGNGGLGSTGQDQYQYAYEGSGVIYSPDGMIVTNNHVVTDDYGDPSDKLEVTLATGLKLPATIIGTDPLTDVAVIKVDAGFDLPAATFVTESPDVGEYAIAIGSPLGYENSVSLGIISGVDRSIEEAQGQDGVALNNLIQTDAPISPGNSGGALGNASGQVIGINVAYEPPFTGAVSIGFAIPSVVVTEVADEIIQTGKATHAYLGVSPQTVTPDLQERFNLSRSTGILVADLTTGGPAEKAGIKQGDIIIKIDDEEMVDSSDVLVAIRDRKPGDVVKVTVDRDGTVLEITVTLEERPANS
jgi:S1-C subfamily serine protease